MLAGRMEAFVGPRLPVRRESLGLSPACSATR